MKITPIRKATEKELQTIARWTIGISHLNLKGARAYFPLISIEKMIAHRESVYIAVSNEFHRERAIKMIPTTNKDVKLLRTNWLNFELSEIDRLYETPFVSDSEKVELVKYRDYVNNELEKNGFSLRHLALIAYYKRSYVPQKTGKLYQHLNDWKKDDYRTGYGGARSTKHKIEIFEDIIPTLNGKQQEEAKDDLKTLKANFETNS